MRVVAGTARGRQLRAPRGRATRPTSDRVREALFSMLETMGAVEGSAVVDLFAGSGALGLEALSRGASSAVFVDQDKAAIDAIRANLDSLGDDFKNRSRVVQADALRFAVNSPLCGVLFVDPPYAFADWRRLLELIGTSATLLVAETGRPWDPGTGWETVKVKAYGDTVVTVFRPVPTGET